MENSEERVLTQEEFDENIERTASEAKQKRDKLGKEEWKQLRIKAKQDLYFLSRLLGYNDISPNLHGHFCAWLDATSHEQFRCTLLPRGHIKSTIATVADSIRCILPDDSGRMPWPYNLGTEARICIIHEVDKQAQRFLFQITQQITANPALIALFPEILPTKGLHKVNQSELILPRNGIYSEPTIDTMGAGAAAQGKHYNLIKPDDIYGVNARDSDAEHNRIVDWIDNLESFFTNAKLDHLDYVGTRYSHDDGYDHIFRLYGAKLKRYIRPVQERQKDGTLQYIYPERFDDEQAERLKKNPKVWIQYTNDPDIHGKEFEEHWKRFYKFRDKFTVETTDIANRVITSDVRDMDRIVLIDPAMKGFAGIVVTGVDERNRIFCLEAKKEEWKPPELVQEVFRIVNQWNPRLVVIEEVLFSGLFKHWFESEMRLRNRRFHIEPCKTNNKQKEVRVRGLANYFASGLIFFNKNQFDLIEEFDQFGATDNYHMLDAMAQGPQFWRKGETRNMIEEQRKAAESVLQGRDRISGYSQYLEDEDER